MDGYVRVRNFFQNFQFYLIAYDMRSFKGNIVIPKNDVKLYKIILSGSARFEKMITFHFSEFTNSPFDKFDVFIVNPMIHQHFISLGQYTHASMHYIKGDENGNQRIDYRQVKNPEDNKGDYYSGIGVEIAFIMQTIRLEDETPGLFGYPRKIPDENGSNCH